MNNLNFVKNGVQIRLPPGFRFHPTDQELLVQYLNPKVYSTPLPASIIPEFHLCKSDPWEFPGGEGGERYFFRKTEPKYPNGFRLSRATVSGYWKATGHDKRIANSRNDAVVGIKKTLVFYTGKPPNEARTDWVMHEYRLAPQKGDWVLCRLFLKNRSRGDKNDAVPKLHASRGRPFYGLVDYSPSASSSASSCLTQLDSKGHEESSREKA